MQAKSRVLLVMIVVLLAALVLSACGGGGASGDGRTWFNLPSAKMTVGPNGSISAYGLPVPGVFFPADLLQQLQAAGVQQIEVRWARNGLHVYTNGEDLPYVQWNAETSARLQDIISKVPGLPNARMIAGAVPWMRRVGTGVKIELPPASGATKVAVPAWKGETAVTPEAAPSTPTIGPIVLDSITFDKEGRGYNGSIPLDSLGVPLNLPPAALSMIASLGIEKLQIKTEADGLNVAINDGNLTKVAYDSAHLERALKLVGAFITDADLKATLGDLLSRLPGADVQATISFTGQPAGEMQLSNVGLELGEDGSLRAMGIALPGGPLVPASALQMLQGAGVQQLDVNLTESGINLAANGQALPAISWSPEGLAAVGAIVGPLTGMAPAQLSGILDIAKTTGVNASVKVPAGAGATPIGDVAPVTEPSYAAVDLGDFGPPIIRADLALDANGNVTSVSDLNFTDLAALGVPASIALPPNIVAILKSTGADEVGIVSDAGKLDLQLDGATAIELQYDEPALRQLFAMVKPLIGVELLNDPGVSKLIDEHILPLAAGAQLDVTLQLP